MAANEPSGMKNPYEKELEQETFTLGRRSMWMLVVAFVLVCLNPPLYRNIYESFKKEEPRWVPAVEFFRRGVDEKGNKLTLLEHLRAFEDKLEKDALFARPPRRALQKGITAVLDAGNRKTTIGRKGWLYFQPALDAMTGYGPLKSEPDSVAKDPNRKPWSGPKGVIERFAGQLEEMGVDLVFVPIPVKPIIYPEALSPAKFDGPAEHPDAAEFYGQLDALPNVTVVNLAQEFWDLKKDGQVFMKQDTHWTPQAMEFAAKRVAESLGLEKGEAQFAVGEPEKRSSIGDLVEKLGVLPEIDPSVPQAGFDLEEVMATPVEAATDPDSEVVLLGDSFVNIYSAGGGLHWGEGAGFSEHLAKELGMPIEVIAINGQAATGVRERLSKRHPISEMQKKKVVIWTVAARDLFLSETPARESKVKWEDVEFLEFEKRKASGDEKKPSGARKVGGIQADEPTLRIDGTITLKSKFPDPNSVTYSDALYGVEYEVNEVLDGEGAEVGEKVVVMHWAFRGKKLMPSSAYEIGDKRTLDLVPFDEKEEVQSTQAMNDTDAFLTWWEEEPEIESAPAEDGGDAAVPTNGSAHTIASVVCALVSLAFVAVLSLAMRRFKATTAA